jgi:hypothetical protein
MLLALASYVNYAENMGGGIKMIQTVKAVIDEDGKVHLLESVSLPEARRALVTILEEEPATEISETALLSEQALAEDWNRPEEDEAWSHLQQVL